MIAEVVKSDTGETERVERYDEVRSFTVPSTRGMVRLGDVTDLLRDDDAVSERSIRALVEQLDADPDTGGHVKIQQPGRASFTAAFERIELFEEDAHRARGSSSTDDGETWLRAVIPKSLDERIFEAVHYDPSFDVYNRSEFVTSAIEEAFDGYETRASLRQQRDRLLNRVRELDEEARQFEQQCRELEYERVEAVPDDELIAEFERRGFDVTDDSGEAYDDVLDGLREYFAKGGLPNWLEDLTECVDAFELEHVEALEEYTSIPGSESPAEDVDLLRYHVVEAENDGFVRQAFRNYHRLPVASTDEPAEQGDEQPGGSNGFVFGGSGVVE